MKSTLILSNHHCHGKTEMENLGRKLIKNNIDILFSRTPWPRDEFLIKSDGSVLYVEKCLWTQESIPHFAYHGGTFLKGDNFILASKTANPKSKQKETEKVLNVENGYYYNIEKELDLLSHIELSKGKSFFKSSFPHIDSIYNLGNSSKKIFTYNEDTLIDTGYGMCLDTNYDLEVFPLSEARYAAIGFVEIGDKIIIDCRAKRTKKILEKIGYNVITTPHPLINTNSNTGSLHCITADCPISYHRFKFNYLNDIKGYGKRFMDNSIEDLLFSNLSKKWAEAEFFNSNFLLKD